MFYIAVVLMVLSACARSSEAVASAKEGVDSPKAAVSLQERCSVYYSALYKSAGDQKTFTYRPNTPFLGGCELDAFSDNIYLPPQAPDFPPSKGKSLSLPGGGSLTLAECKMMTSEFWRRCTFTVTGAPAGATICGQAVVGPVELLVANVTFKANGNIKMRQGSSLGCYTDVPPAGRATQDWARAGALAKCVHWDANGFDPGGVGAKDARYEACLRAVRADYCGDGVEHTQIGEPIDLYDVSGGPVPPDTTSGKTFFKEASWKAGKAICVWKPRIEEVHTGKPVGCRKLFKHHCQPYEQKHFRCSGPDDMEKGILFTRTDKAYMDDDCTTPWTP